MSGRVPPHESSGSDYLLRVLEAQGVSTVFGLVGSGSKHIVDKFHDSDVEFTYARHEQAAASMADGYARVTGEVGVCLFTRGPGVTNAATGIAMADRDNVPLVVIVGDNGLDGGEWELQYLDHGTFTRPISTYQTRVESVAELPDKLYAAFRKAHALSGPAIVGIPPEVQQVTGVDAPYEPFEPVHQRVSPDENAVRTAADQIENADSPVILAGGGARKAGAVEAVLELAETVGAPVATTFFSTDAFPTDHPLVTGISGTFMTPASDDLLWDADLLITVGARLNGKTTRYGDLYGDAVLVQIDIDPGVIGADRTPEVGLVGDARATVEAITERVRPNEGRVDAIERRIREAGSATDVDYLDAGDAIDPRELTIEVADRVPEDSVVSLDPGNYTGFPPLYHPGGTGGRMLVNGNFACMGFALPAALGAQVADPDRTIVCYIGDGALLMVLQELETAVRYELPIVVVVANDDSYGIIRHRQMNEYGRTAATEYPGTDFVDVARALGAEAAEVQSADDLDVLDEFLAERPSVPLVLDAKTIPEVKRPGFPPY